VFASWKANPTPRTSKPLTNSQIPQTPMLVRDFKGLPLEDALKVWPKADDNERKLLRPVLEDKVWPLNPNNYTPKEWAALAAKVRSALKPGVPNKAPMPLPGLPHAGIPSHPPSLHF
jgi:hypothetical protein